MQTGAAATMDPDAPTPSLAALGALLGDPVRAAILLRLTDGSRRPAGELAQLAGASPQAASLHLARLVDGGLLAVETKGRHRFYRIASGEAAEWIEHLSNWAGGPPRRRSDAALCRARFCYDHLAGRLGVAVYEAMVGGGLLCLGAEGAALSEAGQAFCVEHGLDATPRKGSRRPAILLCLDWTERRHHLGGYVGAGFARMMLEAGHIRRREGQRIVDVTPSGTAFLSRTLGLDPAG